MVMNPMVQSKKSPGPCIYIYMHKLLHSPKSKALLLKPDHLLLQFLAGVSADTNGVSTRFHLQPNLIASKVLNDDSYPLNMDENDWMQMDKL